MSVTRGRDGCADPDRGTAPHHRHSGLNRRTMLKCSAALLLPAALVAQTEKTGMTDALWNQWQADWRWMEGVARKRGWKLTPLSIAPPAPEVAVSALEARHGIKVPSQLRELLTRYSAYVAFGWHIPTHLQPMEQQNLPTMSLNRGAIWDFAHIDEYAIPNFLEWKKRLANRDVAAAPNRPEMWEHQFPFYDLVNGDMLTVDMSNPEGQQPVRYFSHELDTLHGLALAPDFVTFITRMSQLGFAGTEWASWTGFGTLNEAGRTYYLTADSPGGKAWRAWLTKDPAVVEADEPPPAIVEQTPAEHALLRAARANDTAGVTEALKAGARPDVVPDSDWMMKNGAWDQEFATALTFAVRANNLPLAELLLERGATLNTRRLVMADAVQESTLDTVRWLIGRGARVNGWKGERHWPIHLLVSRRSRMTAPTRAALEARLRRGNSSAVSSSDFKEWLGSKEESQKILEALQKSQEILRESEKKRIQSRLATWLDRPSYLAILEALLKAGADPDARWDNGSTMLMEADADDGEMLLRAGADIDARDVHGSSALHRSGTPAKIRMLVAYGADVDALQTPPPVEQKWAHTPLQSALLLSMLHGLEGAKTLLELKADPTKRDGGGRSTLCYCTNIESFKLIAAYGLDPHERLPDGGTLLHNLIRVSSARAAVPDEVAFLDFLLDLGLPINAVDNEGRTVLHLATERIETAADIALLLQRGADKTIHDRNGQRPVDLVPKSLTEIRALLT